MWWRLDASKVSLPSLFIHGFSIDTGILEVAIGLSIPIGIMIAIFFGPELMLRTRPRLSPRLKQVVQQIKVNRHIMGILTTVWRILALTYTLFIVVLLIIWVLEAYKQHQELPGEFALDTCLLLFTGDWKLFPILLGSAFLTLWSNWKTFLRSPRFTSFNEPCAFS